MPALDLDKPGASAVNSFRQLLETLVKDGTRVKESGIEPVLTQSDFPDLSTKVATALPESEGDDKSRQFAIIEGAARELFGTIIANVSIENPEFVQMWNFLDILCILSDEGHCDPALMFWLVEELLDSQTINGSRIIFDYLDSRRERITVKYFNQKKLVILRACNELLRRLSRAEDTAFCGRVFIFMFQCFPLGDRSSVNLRGEYHVENITSYETDAPDTKMEVDEPKQQEEQTEADGDANDKAKTADKKPEEETVDPEALYPLFWSLQNTFSQPLNLLDQNNFTTFRSSLEATMKAFETLKEDSQQTLKRKREDDSVPDAFNPKYLTSKDLFELEISDLSFRRNILVQALIVTDFLLSLSPEAKEKMTTVGASNKAVIYQGTLSAENVKWAVDIKKRISEYLRKGYDGPYFNRMVETVLARDKNWVFWKMASCPPIQKEPVSTAGFIEAKSSAQQMTTSKRLRKVPMGAVSMTFLNNDDKTAAMDELKSEERYHQPELESFERGIADDDFEIDMPTNNDTKAQAIAGKSSKSWRALRIAGRSKLAAFDKIDDPNKINIIFRDHIEDDQDEVEQEETATSEDMPSDQTAVIFTGPHTLIAKLMEQHKGVFGSVVRHAARQPNDGETANQTFHFVTPQEFAQLRDGDRLIESGERDKIEYGTSTKAIEAVLESGKVPLIELDAEAAQFAKDMDFEARYITINPDGDEVPDGFLVVRGGDENKMVTQISNIIYGKQGAGDGDESKAADGNENKNEAQGDAEQEEDGSSSSSSASSSESASEDEDNGEAANEGKQEAGNDEDAKAEDDTKMADA